MYHICQQIFESEIKGVIYKIMKTIYASPNTSKVVIFLKNLGRSLQFAASLSDIRSTIPSSEAHNSRINWPFVTMKHYTTDYVTS